MNPKVITNAVQAEMPTDLKAEVGKPLVINLAPPGEYPQTIDDPDAEGGRREVNQILDEKAIDTLINNFKDKVLVDADHSSETSTNTKAMAWVTRLFKDPEKGLMAEIEPTSIGADNINGKVYRFVSGAWTLDDDGRPVELVSIGLTNRPNLPVAPIINSAAVNTDNPGTVDQNGDSVTDDVQSAANAEPTDDVAEPVVDPVDPHESDPVVENEDQDLTNEGNNQMIEQLKEKLGLAPETTDEEVLAAVEALIARCGAVEEVANALGLEPTVTNEDMMEALNAVISQCGEFQAKNEADEQARIAGEADALVAENEDVIPEESVEDVKNEYMEDPEAAKATVANMRRVYERAVANCKATAPVQKPVHVVIKNSEAKKPVALNMADALASCGGDPAKELEALRTMYAKH